MRKIDLRFKKAQTAIEYLLLLALVALIVLISFPILMPKTQAVSNTYFDKISNAIMDEPPQF